MTLLRFLVLWALAGGAELPLLANLTGLENYPAVVAWGSHVLAAALAGLAVVQWDGLFNLTQRWTWWLVLWVLLIPGAGWVFGGMLVLVGWNAREPDKVLDGEDELVAALGIDLSKPAEMSSARIAKELDFVPLVEVLAGDDINLKRGAIEQLTRLRTPDAIQVLMSHRSDPSMEMRFYINSSLVRIKKEFDEALDAARYQLRLDVDNAADRLNLAKIYLSYVNSGLLDADLMTAYAGEAAFHLNFVMNSLKPTREASLLLITDQMRLRCWDKADESVRKANALTLISDTEMAEYQAEITYSRKQFDKIADALRAISPESSLSAEWKSTLLWWGVQS